MMTTTMTAAELIRVMYYAHKKYGYNYFGFRSDDAVYSVGDICERSRGWDFELDVQSDELLDGTCTTGLAEIWFGEDRETDEDNVKEVEYKQRHNYAYPGEHQYLVGGSEHEYGNDEHEMIISGAEVLAVLF